MRMRMRKREVVRWLRLQGVVGKAIFEKEFFLASSHIAILLNESFLNS
jgi:hypothetical protein